MRIPGTGGLRRLVLAAPMLAIAAGCAAPAPGAQEGTAIVKSVERRGWDADTETGLFRIDFDAKRMQSIRREAATYQGPEGMEPYTVELRFIDREASRELKAKGLCSGDATRVSPLNEGDGRSGASGIFKCRPPLF